MKKIPSLYLRDWEGNRNLVTRELNPECEWVIKNEGIPTRKWDGTACLIQDGKLFKRYDAKNGKTPPEGFMPAQPEPDAATGHWPGWIEISPDKPEDKWHREAFTNTVELLAGDIPNGTFELCGPKVQGNPEGFNTHFLISHEGSYFENKFGAIETIPTDFDGLRSWLESQDIEGIVWHHPDGRMAKIKKSDFGLARREEDEDVEEAPEKVLV